MGTSCLACSLCVRHKDHPHAYGDKCRIRKLTLQKTGSSPRVWGQAASPVRSVFVIRIIPTRMGTSSALRGFAPLVSGSSPRVWGQAKIFSFLMKWNRIIPTRMGTRICGRLIQRHSWDHPHAYGDKDFSKKFFAFD